jgi:hypothetical protein
MSVGHFTKSRISKFEPILFVLNTRKYQLIMLVSAITYALTYMFAIGIISYYPGFAPLIVSSPVISANSLGVIVIPISYVFVFASYSAIVFLIVSSFLIALNIALVLYLRSVSNTLSCARRITNVNTRRILGILPAFFTSFSCCGGGFMALILGPTAISSLALYSQYMASVTIAVLLVATIFTSMKISRSHRPSSLLNYYYCESKGDKM